MKALLPVYCRPLGYVVLLVALFIPFILVMQGVVTDTNLLFYKECCSPFQNLMHNPSPDPTPLSTGSHL